MSTLDPKSRVVSHSIPNPTVNGRLLEYSFGRFQNTTMGGYSGTHPDQGSFLHLRNCTSSEESALSADTGPLMIRHQILRLPHLILPSHTAWPQKTGKSHPNDPLSTSTPQFALQWFYVSTTLGKSKVFQSLRTSASPEVWPPSLRRTESRGNTFQGINQTLKPGRNRETVGEAFEKSASQWSLEANATAERRRGLMKAKMLWSLSFERFWHAY